MTGTGRASFSGHETFPFRYTWLKKAVDAVGGDEYAFHADDAMVKFGVGKNMVSSIRHWGVATGMLEEGAARRGSRIKPFRATELGAMLFREEGWDPFLEDPGTLWLLHWQLVSRPERATTWWWVFNQYPGTVFTRAEIQEAIETLCATSGESTPPRTMARDSAAAQRRRLRSFNTGDTAAYFATMVASSSTLRCMQWKQTT